MLFISILAISLSKKSTAPYFENSNRPLIIAHRGACGYVPEHSLPAYQIAGYMGADFVEPDLVLTSDGQMIINHDVVFDGTTNVAEIPQFASKKTTKTIPTFKGNWTKTGWFASDFSYEETQELVLRQRFSFRPQSMNNLFKIQKIEEALDWIIQENSIRSSNNKSLLGAYIELKEPTYYSLLGFDMPKILLEILEKKGVSTIEGASKICPIILQCFEMEALKDLSEMTDLPLVFLMSKGAEEYDLNDIAEKVNGIGPDFSFIFDGKDSTGFVEEAHNLNLALHPWVVRDDELPSGYTVKDYYLKIKYENLDGIFTEFPDSANQYFNLLN